MAATSDEVSIAVIADTQMMTRAHPELFPALPRHILQLAEPWHIRAVLHVGDVVNDGAEEPDQYQVAAEALRQLPEAGMPLLIAPGNHDYDNMLDTDRSLSEFNTHLGKLSAPSLHASYQPDHYENSWAEIPLPQGKMAILTLEFGPRETVLAWADDILTAHPDHVVLVNTHAHLYLDGTRTRPGLPHHPRDYAGSRDGCDGEEVWQRLIRKHGNIVAVFSGHHVWDNVSHRIDSADDGRPILQSFQNWQGEDQGGAGRFRLVTVDPVRRRIRMQVCNPVTGEFEHETGYDVSADLGPADPGPADPGMEARSLTDQSSARSV